VFRFFFGLIMFFETAGAVAIGWVKDFYIDPKFTFSFIGFEWLQPLPGYWIYAVFLTMSLLALCIAFGYKYRLAITLFTIGWFYVYLIHKTSYNNHHYLMCLLLLIFCILPAHRANSLDVKQGRVKEQLWCYSWHIWIFIALYFVVYIYAAIAKLYPDWYSGIPLDLWFAPKESRWLIGGFYASEIAPLLFAWGGIVFDFLVIPAMIWKPTRKTAFIISILFHLGNSLTFEIGTFPYLMIFSAVLFFEPEQVQRIFLKKRGECNLPELLGTRKHTMTAILLSGFFAIQILLPLRQHAFTGNTFWTEEGHRLSWRMMLKVKRGRASFNIEDSHGKRIVHDPLEHLTRSQFYTMSTHPDMIWQYVQYLKSLYGNEISVHVRSIVQINRGKRANLIDPSVDLSKEEWNRFSHHDWIAEFPGWISPE